LIELDLAQELSNWEFLMGLSEREQQLLDELERGLMDSDKGIAAKAKRVGNPAAKLIGGALLAVVGLGVLLTGVLIQFSIVGVVGFLIMLAGLFVATSNIQLPDLSSGFGQSTPNSPKPGRNFFEDRWDKRHGE
jgi:predicted lipid-binding transport protein (Tim44 family)